MELGLKVAVKARSTHSLTDLVRKQAPGETCCFQDDSFRNCRFLLNRPLL